MPSGAYLFFWGGILKILFILFFCFVNSINAQTIWFAGKNDTYLDAQGNIGNSFKKFTIINPDTNWTDISNSNNHITAIKNDSTLWTWGYGPNGELGLNGKLSSEYPHLVDSNSKWISISSNYHNIALKSGNSLWAWGRNQFGQVGDGTYNDRFIPFQISIENDWIKVEAMATSSIALKKNGTLWTWGDNALGQLGTNKFSKINIPTQIGTESDWIDFRAGAFHVFALKKDSSWWAWGYNSKGQTGDSLNLTNNSLPKKINFNIKFKDIFPGFSNTVAVDSNEYLWGWGFNFRNFLTSNTSTTILSPIRIYNLKEIYKVYIDKKDSSPSTFFLKKDSTMFALGINNSNKFGVGSELDYVVPPLQLSNEKNWLKIATSWKYSLALRSTNAKASIGKIIIPDTTVELSNSVCLPISVNFQKVTPANAYKGTFTARFVYNPFVFSFDPKLNNEKYSYQVKDSDDKQVLIITSDSIMFEKETKITFYLCLKTYLADTLKSDIRADDLDFTGFGRASLDTGTITFVGCGLNLRRIKFFKATEFITKNNVINDKFEIDIKTEESGEFAVELINSIGMKIKEIKWDNDGNDKSLNLNFTEYAQGCYFINLRSPIYSKTIKVLKL